MKLYDRVYRDPVYRAATTTLGTVIATSADGADVFEGETVDVTWDGSTEPPETIEVSTLDRIETHPCGCPLDVAASTLSNRGQQCSSCGSCWDGEDFVYTLRQGPLNEATYARLSYERADYGYQQALAQVRGTIEHLNRVAAARSAAAAALTGIAHGDERAAVQRDRETARQQLDDLNALIKSVTRERDLVQKELTAAAEVIAAGATTDAELLTVSGSAIGSNRLTEIACGLHPAIMGFVRWAPPEARNVGPNTPIQTQLGLALRLDYKPADHYIDELAEALREFNRRFVTDYTPEPGGFSGFADLITAADGMYCHIEYTPGSSDKAALLARDTVMIEGPLPQVLLYATQYAWYRGGPASEDEDN